METISTFSSSTEREIINFQIPTSWAELSDKQLLFLYQLMGQDFSTDEVKTLCLLQWGSAKVETKGSVLLMIVLLNV